jgi:hypothetical protein
MGSRNFGIGSRDMERAGHMVLAQRSGLSFSSVATISERWGQFSDWAKEDGINKMENITNEDIVRYGEELADRLEPSTAQNYVSAVNTVMKLARGDQAVWVSPTKDCGIPKCDGVATENRATSAADHAAILQQVPERVGVLRELERALGFRFKESALANARHMLAEAKNNQMITVTDGTKGGRDREVPISSEHQILVLERAAAIQDGRSMVPQNTSYIQFARECYRQTSHFHGERHAYAQGRYENIAGVPCPLLANVKHGKPHHEFMAEKLGVSLEQAKQIDQTARMQIAEELGHSRTEITNAYLG